MCLYTKIKPEKAKNDITCYKLVLKTPFGYETPYRHTCVHEECMNGTKKFEANRRIDIKDVGNQFEIHGGMIHTYHFRDDAQDCAASNNAYFLRPGFSYEVWECVIPKGTECTWGVNRDDVLSYASKSIKFIKKICV